MAILQGLFLFAFFYLSGICFGAEDSEPCAQFASTGTALVSLSQQFKEDLREVNALCWMRFSLNKALLCTNKDEGYRTGVKNDIAFYIKANKILKLINTSSSGVSSSGDKLNRSSIDKLYREVSKYVQTRTDQERTERIAYKDLLKEKKKEKGGGPLRSSFDEIVNELPSLRQIKDILGRYASKHEVEMARFLESDVTCTLVNVNVTKIINELEKVVESFFSLLGVYDFSELESYKNSAEFKRSKPLIGLKDRLAFEKAHPKISPGGEVALPKTPQHQAPKTDGLQASKTEELQASKTEGVVEIVKLLCAVKDFMEDVTIEKILESKKTVSHVIHAEEVQQDVLCSLKEKIGNLLENIGGIQFGDSTLDTKVQKYLTERLELITHISDGFLNRIKILSLTDKILDELALDKVMGEKEVVPTLPPESLSKHQTDKILQRVEGLNPEKKELEISDELALDKAMDEKEVVPTFPPESLSKHQAEPLVKPKELAEESTEYQPPPVSKAEKKERGASDKTKKKTKGVLQPSGYQEKSPIEIEKARKKKLRDMVQELRQSWKSIKFRDIKRAVGQLGGTIEPNGRNSHYIIRLRHIDTDHLVLGATLSKKAMGGEYPWWLDTAVDALERAAGLVTDDMSRIYEKVHKG